MCGVIYTCLSAVVHSDVDRRHEDDVCGTAELDQEIETKHIAHSSDDCDADGIDSPGQNHGPAEEGGDGDDADAEDEGLLLAHVV